MDSLIGTEDVTLNWLRGARRRACPRRRPPAERTLAKQYSEGPLKFGALIKITRALG